MPGQGRQPPLLPPRRSSHQPICKIRHRGIGRPPWSLQKGTLEIYSRPKKIILKKIQPLDKEGDPKRNKDYLNSQQSKKKLKNISNMEVFQKERTHVVRKALKLHLLLLLLWRIFLAAGSRRRTTLRRNVAWLALLE